MQANAVSVKAPPANHDRLRNHGNRRRTDAAEEQLQQMANSGTVRRTPASSVPRYFFFRATLLLAPHPATLIRY